MTPATPAPASLSIIDMLDVLSDSVEISPGQSITVRPLSLDEMVSLLNENRPLFFKLYSITTKMLNDPKSTSLDFGPVVMGFPNVIARIIATSMEERDVPAATEAVRRRMPITLQLIALEKIWKLSVPDPKKLLDLLSVVMGRLQNPMPDAGETSATPSPASPTILPPPSNSLSATDTTPETSSATP